MTSGIYAIVHRDTGRAYVGSTKCFAERWSAHTRALRRGNHDNIRLQRAWNKYGPGAFAFEKLERVGGDAELYAREQVYIDALGEFNAQKVAGGSHRGRRFCAATRARMSAGQRGRKHPPEVRAKIAASQRGRKRSPETRERIQAAQDKRKGVPRDPACVEKMRATKRANGVQVTLGSRTQCLSAWAEESGLSIQTLKYRLTAGWSLEKALSTPVRRKTK